MHTTNAIFDEVCTQLMQSLILPDSDRIVFIPFWFRIDMLIFGLEEYEDLVER